ncbi:hypothetical protein STEG23_032345, partial [Scotinomys teguina]
MLSIKYTEDHNHTQHLREFYYEGGRETRPGEKKGKIEDKKEREHVPERMRERDLHIYKPKEEELWEEKGKGRLMDRKSREDANSALVSLTERASLRIQKD